LPRYYLKLCFLEGSCEKTIQDVVERFWDIIEEINVAKTLRFLKDNIVSKYCKQVYTNIGDILNSYE